MDYRIYLFIGEMMLPKSWYGDTEFIALRLQGEQMAMQHFFKGAFTLTTPEQGSWFWQGILTLNMKGIDHPEHTLKIVYPDYFPALPPTAYVINPPIQPSPYQYRDGSLGLFNPHDGVEQGWNPAKSTAATIAIWSTEWLYAYYTWKITGTWPQAKR